ncbi:MBOAT family protein [candidate division KSB1 bacterium]|nr:MBOAT family protein [candidate division KSB1 bacterium]
MLFNSLQFAFFFFGIVLLYFIIPYRFRWLLLLVGSYFFYMCWNWKYISLIVVSTLIDYFAGRRMVALPTRKKRLKYLLLSLLANLGLLFTFKYWNFFFDSLNTVSSALNFSFQVPYVNVLLPVGISFYTFQTLSYSIDVYRGVIKEERHLGIFALYVSFFPQLVAGPIERASRLLPQLLKKNDFDEYRTVSGLRLMLWGLFKKIVVANRLAIYVDAVYANVEFHSALSLLIATYLFAFQIYCDFSGYSDIAIGAARVMGYDLMKNFNRPYFSRTINEFWSRWHISLSTWFRDYLYIPLGGNRSRRIRANLNLFIVFLVSGMWHGANWTFLIWGALHGLYAGTSKMTLAFRNRLVEKLHAPKSIVNGVRIFVTFQLVCLGWVYFRASSIGEANFIVKQILSFDPGTLFVPALDQFIYGLLAILITLLVDSGQEWFGLMKKFVKWPRTIKWMVYLALAVVMILIGVFDESQFIYFQF